MTKLERIRWYLQDAWRGYFWQPIVPGFPGLGVEQVELRGSRVWRICYVFRNWARI